MFLLSNVTCVLNIYQRTDTERRKRRLLCWPICAWQAKKEHKSYGQPAERPPQSFTFEALSGRKYCHVHPRV